MMKLRITYTLRALALGSLLLAAQGVATADDVKLLPKAAAVAHLKPAANSKVTGTVQFIPTDKGVRVVAHVVNLTPGDHGFHVHEKGDLSAPDFTSAGPHFNPTGDPHAGPHDERRHMGDLGNLEANSDGVAKLDYVDHHLKLEGEHSIMGRSVIVHAGKDDLKSQPSGDSGARVAGGKIEAVKK